CARCLRHAVDRDCGVPSFETRRPRLGRPRTMMQHQRVPVWVLENGHVADAAVHRLAEELDPLRLEPSARLVDAIDVERDRVRVAVECWPKASGCRICSVRVPVSNSPPAILPYCLDCSRPSISP